MTVKPLTLDALDALCALEASLFDAADFPLNRRAFRYHLKKGTPMMGLFENEKLLGYILAFEYKKSLRIYSIGVDETMRNRGIGKKLLQTMIEDAVLKQKEYLSLEVKYNNGQAIKLYESLGFKPIRVLKNYYLDGADGLKMRLRTQL